jgi:hypothetical protein|nr:MAG TPA: hypothetical protein [Caudoviricetes sp.]
MKRYKLLKDTPTLKAGTIFEEVVGDFDGLRALTRITPVGAKTSPHFTIKDIDNFDEWFEEIPEKHERWRGGRGDGYYFIDDEGVIRHEIDTNDDMDNYRYNAGIYGRTEQELKVKLEYDIARQVLLDDAEGGKCIEYGKNWHAYYDTITKTYHPVHSISYFYPGIIYFRTEEALEKSLKEHEEQWKIVRKYEIGEM